MINPSSNSCSGSADCGNRLRWVGQSSGVGSAVIDLFTSASSQGDVQYQVIRSTTQTTMYTERRQASNGYYHNHCAICMCKDPSKSGSKISRAIRRSCFAFFATYSHNVYYHHLYHHLYLHQHHNNNDNLNYHYP